MARSHLAARGTGPPGSPTPRAPRVRSNIRPVVGVVLILLFMFVVGPIGLFIVAGIWSAFFGWLLVDDTERREGAGSEAQTS